MLSSCPEREAFVQTLFTHVHKQPAPLAGGETGLHGTREVEAGDGKGWMGGEPGRKGMEMRGRGCWRDRNREE